MTRRARLRLFAVAVAVFGFVFVYGLTGLPRVGHYHGVYGTVIARVAVPQRKATDAVNTITFDYRGLDTLGEEFILFASAVGLVVLLREQRDERRDEQGDADPADRRHGNTSVALRLLGLGLVGPMLVLGVYVASHGQLTPGGGFQGGLILAGALVLVFLAGRRLAMERVRPIAVVEVAEGVGAAGFAALGVGGLLAGSEFLFNFLPLGSTGTLLSGGTIGLLSAIVGIEVAGAFTLIFSEFMDQRLLARRS